MLRPSSARLEGINRAASKKISSPLQENNIRLLILLPGSPSDRIQCHLKVARLSPSPRYEALSYVCGATGHSKPLSLDSQQYQVTQNLAKALQELRLPDSNRVLWVDALCIYSNQTAMKYLGTMRLIPHLVIHDSPSSRRPAALIHLAVFCLPDSLL